MSDVSTLLAQPPVRHARSGGVVTDEQLTRRLRSGGGWLCWIAGLSVINSAVLMVGGELSLVIGLGVTQLVDRAGLTLAAEMHDGRLLALGSAVAVSLAVAAIFLLLGAAARRGSGAAFVGGMALYALDGLLVLTYDDWFGAAFHLIALVGILAGYSALRRLRRRVTDGPRLRLGGDLGR